MNNVIKSLDKIVSIPLGLTAAASSADAGIHKITLGSRAATLITSNEEMEDIMKILKSLEDSGLLLKSVSEIIQTETKEQKGEFLSMILSTLGASLLGNMVTDKRLNRAVEGKIRASYGSKGSSIKDL